MLSVKQKIQITADVGLLCVAIIWGANFVVIKKLLSEITPMVYLGIRFLLAFLVLFCLSPQSIIRTGRKDILKAAGVGMLLFGGFAAQTLGLYLTTPAVSGFLTVSYVVFVPAILTLWKKEFPGKHIILGSIFTVTGVGFLSLNDRIMLGQGEVLTLVCALFFALHILALDKVSASINPYVLTAVQLGTIGVFSFISALAFESFTLSFSFNGWMGLIYGVIFGSIGGYFGQTVAQRYTKPSHAAIILSQEAVFALLFSVVFNMEHLSARHIIGFVSVFSGVMIVEIFSYKKSLLLEIKESRDFRS